MLDEPHCTNVEEPYHPDPNELQEPLIDGTAEEAHGEP